MTALYDWLFRHVLRLDMSGAGPPWPLLVWSQDTQTWDTVGIVGSTGPAGPEGATGPSYAALCTGDPAPAMIGTGDGQPVLVPIL